MERSTCRTHRTPGFYVHQRRVTWVKRVAVQHASFAKALQLLRLHFVPRNVGHAQLHVPVLLVVRLDAFV